jgi:predicted nucleic acid-binding protein
LRGPFLLDTSVLIAHADEAGHVATFVARQVSRERLHIAALTLYEVERAASWQQPRTRTDFAMQRLLAACVVLEMPVGVWRLAADLYRLGQSLRPTVTFPDADLAIYATARFHGRALVTADVKFADKIRAVDHRAALRVLAP